MKKFKITNSTHLAIFELKSTLNQILGWSISIFSIMFLYMILFPSIKDMANIKLEAMPDSILELVGMTDIKSLSDFTTYFSMIFNIILIAISVFAVTFSAKTISNEEKNKSIEFIYSLNVSRIDIYLSKILTAFIAVLAVVFSSLIATLICGFINGGDSFDVMKVITIGKISGFIPFFFVGIGIFISALSTKVNGSTIGSMTVIFTYMMGYLSKLIGENGEFLKYLSPLEMLNGNNVLAMSSPTIISLVVYMLLFLTLLILGGFIYKKRDFSL